MHTLTEIFAEFTAFQKLLALSVLSMSTARVFELGWVSLASLVALCALAFAYFVKIIFDGLEAVAARNTGQDTEDFEHHRAP